MTPVAYLIAKEHFIASQFRRTEHIPSFSPPTFSKWSWDGKKITDAFGPLITGESGKPSSIPSAKILHTLTLTVDKEDYFH